MEGKYRDKVYLSNYSLDTNLFDEFGFLVEDAAPIRSVYILKTNRGMKILKKIDYDMEELSFINDSLNIIREEYPYIINFSLSTKGNIFVNYEGGNYIVIDLIEGRDCVFQNPLDLKKASLALAKLHRAGERVELICPKRNNLGKLLDKYHQRMRQMEKFKEIANLHIIKSQFDEIYLQQVDYYIKCVDQAIDQISASSYFELCNTRHTLCHHDLAHHNILISEDDNVYFLDFDYSMIDLPYHDLSNIITKSVKNSEWDNEICNYIIKGYMEERELSKQEIKVLYGYLLFPQDFYDITSGYYLKNRGWDEEEFVDKLKRKVEYKENREGFLNKFREEWIGV